MNEEQSPRVAPEIIGAILTVKSFVDSLTPEQATNMPGSWEKLDEIRLKLNAIADANKKMSASTYRVEILRVGADEPEVVVGIPGHAASMLWKGLKPGEKGRVVNEQTGRILMEK